MNLNSRLKECTDNQHKYSVGSYEYNYWQSQKYKVNEKIEETLSEPQRLAIFLYRKLCKLHEEEMNKWIEESPEFVHDWKGKVHKKYLKMAMEFFEPNNKDFEGHKIR